ncbi:MAG TPA: iron-containing alcohol dehydrogenase [Lacunisphaera sp.]|nr:iron-containing alcohol dehydrogenase [Lacunisphaera sp.]
MRFEFATAGRIIFGSGTLRETGPIAKTLGRRAFVVTGRDAARARPLLDRLAGEAIAVTPCTVEGEPTVDAVNAATSRAREAACDFVVGFGGGSALDAAKAVAALLANPGDPLEFLEVVGRGRPLPHPAAPCLAIPTTAGTGSEVTRNAVLAVPAAAQKVSLRHASMLPRVALVDPELSRGLPPALTASTGLDAVTQLIEPYVSNRANPFTDGLCAEGLRRAARALRRAFCDGHDLAAREDMAVASLFGGLALANAGLGAVHGFAAPIGGMFPAPHGAVCAALLPHVMRANIAAARSRAPDTDALRRYEDVARWLTGRAAARPEEGVAWVEALVAELRIPRLAAHGVQASDFAAIAAKATQASSMKANPVPLTPDELHGILAAAL